LCASRFRRNVLTEPLPSNTCSFSQPLDSNGTTRYNIYIYCNVYIHLFSVQLNSFCFREQENS
jgi:hypothetical protein